MTIRILTLVVIAAAGSYSAVTMNAVAQVAPVRAVGPYVMLALGGGLLIRDSRPLTPSDPSPFGQFELGTQNARQSLTGYSLSVGGGARVSARLGIGIEYTYGEVNDGQYVRAFLAGPNVRVGPHGSFVVQGAMGRVEAPFDREGWVSEGGEGYEFQTTTRTAGFAAQVGVGVERMLTPGVAGQLLVNWTTTSLPDPSGEGTRYHYLVVRAAMVVIPEAFRRGARRDASSSPCLRLVGCGCSCR